MKRIDFPNIQPHTGGVYAIVCNANDKKYIGSSKDVRERLVRHWRDLKENRHMNPLLQNDWNKYGEYSFSTIFLEDSNGKNRRELIECEQYWYDYYQSWNVEHGYNRARRALCPSVDTNIEDLKCHKREISHKQFERLCMLLQETTASFKEIGSMTGVHPSTVFAIYSRAQYQELTKNMQFLSRHQNLRNAAVLTEAQVIEIIDLLKKDYTVQQVAQLYSVSGGTVSDIKTGKTWKRLTKDQIFHHGWRPATVPLGKSIVQMGMSGNVLATYQNAREAERATGVGYKLISRVCCGKREHAHGYKWRFAAVD